MLDLSRFGAVCRLSTPRKTSKLMGRWLSHGSHITEAPALVHASSTVCHLPRAGPVLAQRACPSGQLFARRYVLFSLAGIAGEDDLDAPDLNAPGPPETRTKKQKSNGQPGRHVAPKSQAVGDAKEPFNSANPALKGQLSAVLRDQLLNQLGDPAYAAK
jgi:hypothetical protein